MNSEKQSYKWTFRKSSNLNQVVLEKGDDFRHLHDLDPKLWVALSCPVAGMEFDERTLSLIDTDKDGKIRIPEVIEAMDWFSARVKDPSCIKNVQDEFPLLLLNTDVPEGERLAKTARIVLDNAGKNESNAIRYEDIKNAMDKSSEQTYNGDGIMPAQEEFTPEVRQFITDAMMITGSVTDSGGKQGVNEEIADSFFKTLQNWVQWRKVVSRASSPLQDNTAEAWALLNELKDKIDDYFLRCDMAAYAPSTQAVLNVEEQFKEPIDGNFFTSEILSEMPLSYIQGGKPLYLTKGINPAWRIKAGRFAELISPLLDTPNTLTTDSWQSLQNAFKPYKEALALKPAPEKVAVDVQPSAMPDKLGSERITQILSSGVIDQFKELVKTDKEAPTSGADIAALERLFLYYSHLYHLLVNFVTFDEFYDVEKNAAFQCGQLYLDSRQAKLCVLVADVEQHSVLASSSYLYIAYCRCVRGKNATGAPEKVINIAAAVTAGDSDYLVVGRNGVFVDNKGQDWDATITKIITNPISLWQAVWSPYKKIGSLVGDQINKLAGDKQDELLSSASTGIGKISAVAPAATAQTAPAKFDIGRNVGIFAAVGLALGALGTAAASIAKALFALSWWQFPVLIASIFVIISGPSVVMAWLKLRKRTVGPLLEASGWAINSRVDIGYGLSRTLTVAAKVPKNSYKAEPLHPRPKRFVVFIISFILGVLLVAGGAGLYKYKKSAKVDKTEVINVDDNKTSQK